MTSSNGSVLPSQDGKSRYESLRFRTEERGDGQKVTHPEYSNLHVLNVLCVYIVISHDLGYDSLSKGKFKRKTSTGPLSTSNPSSSVEVMVSL